MKPRACRCKAYAFPHRLSGGKCRRRPAKPLVLPPGYHVTRDGRVFSNELFKRNQNPHRCVELRQHMNGSGHGYPSVWLWRNSRKWHVAVYRLVAAVYLEAKPFASAFVCHRDGDRMNSRADNLYWGTASQNNHDAWKHRRQNQQVGLPFEASDALTS